MATTSTDTFTDTDGVLLENHTPDLGPSWAKSLGVSNILSNNCRLVGSLGHSDAETVYTLDVGTPDSWAQISNFFDNGMLIVRYIDINNFYYFQSAVGIRKRVAGVDTTIQAFGGVTQPTLEIIGSTLSLYSGPSKIFLTSVVDTDLISGNKVGLGNPLAFSALVDNWNAGTALTVPADPSNLEATCITFSPPNTNFTTDKDREVIEKVEGLLTITQGSAAVSGFGTKFTEDLVAGDKIVLNDVVYEVLSVTNDTELILTTVYADASADRITAWKPITISFTNTTPPNFQFINGTIEVVNGSNSIVGTGTLFTSELVIGQTLLIADVEYIVDTITDDTHLTLTQVYAGTSDDNIRIEKKEIHSFFWDFGDGTFSTEENPTHVYSDGGTYEAKLTVFSVPPLSGTVSATTGSNTIEGIGTSFLTELVAGESIILNGISYEIQSITDNDTLVLVDVYDRVSSSDVTILKRTNKLTGTISVIQNSKTITGSGTSFLTELSRGESIEIDGISYVISNIVSDTEITLMNAYSATDASGLSVFHKLSRFDGAHVNDSASRTLSIAGKDAIDINYLNGDFEISLLSLTQLTGTLNVVNGVAVVNGIGTSFLTELVAGEQIVIDGVVYTIDLITNDTVLTLTQVYSGITDTGLDFFKKSTKKAGTIAVTNSNATVLGSGTSFLLDYSIGNTIIIEGVDYLIDDIVNNNELTLSFAYTGATNSGLNHFKGDSSYSNSGTSPFIVNFIDGTLGEVTEYLWDFGDGPLVIRTGTLSVIQGSQVVIGSGTLFTSELAEGDKIEIDGLLYKIANIISDTELVLISYFSGNTQSGLTYKQKQAGTTSSLANPEIFLSDSGIFEITLEVVKDATVYSITKAIQVKASPTSPTLPSGGFAPTMGKGASKLSGTVGVTNGSTTILGSNTRFSTELTEGGFITMEGVTYTIDQIINDEELTLTQKYIGGSTTRVSLTGIIDVVNGSNSIVGTGTLFTSELVIGQTLLIDNISYVIEEIISDTSLKLTYVYDGTTSSSLPAETDVGVLTQGITAYIGFIGIRVLTGTLAVTQGSLKVIGTGTSFTTELLKNDKITIEGTTYSVIGILSDTELILSKVYSGITQSGIIAFVNSKSAPLTNKITFTNLTSDIFKELTGTVDTVNGDATILGTGTLFTSELEIGQTLDIEGVFYTVDAIISDTELELSNVYSGITDTGLTIKEKLINSFFWDFGDGTFSTEENPTHVYSESGSFKVVLTVTNENGATSHSQTIESLKIDFYSVDHNNSRVNMFAFKSTGSPKLVKFFGGFGNGRGQFNGLEDLVIVGKGKKTLEGMEV